MHFNYTHKFILIILALSFSPSVSHSEMTASQIAQEYTPAVVTIIALDENDQPLSLGSGFFINAEGDIATNHHVLEGCAKAIIKTITGRKEEIIEIIKDDPELDLVIAKTSTTNIRPLPLGNSDSITVGEDIVAIGNPAGLEGTISKGIISGIRKTEEIKLIQITAPISPGSSGGPVFNMSGNVIGIATAYINEGQNLNFMMPINYLKTLKQNKVKLFSLPKANSKGKTAKNYSSIEIFDKNDKFYSTSDEVFSNFAIRNLNDYSIKNIKLFFVYKNYKGEVVTYSAKKISETILPKLSLQFSHYHKVKNFIEEGKEYEYTRSSEGVLMQMNPIHGSVEIRILDYEIDRTSSSPTDLLFK